MKPAVIVIGAINQDLLFSVRRAPAAGETILADSVARSSGGKGANQAAAAARANARTALVSAVGGDEVGVAELQALRGAGVDVSEVARLADEPTGMAVITVSSDGENSIIVALGANGRVQASEVERSLARLCAPDCVVVLQTELPTAVIEAAASWCASKGIRVLINNGPCVSLSGATLRVADPLVVNETEASQMIGTAASEEPEVLARALHQHAGARSVVVTLGGRGCQWQDATHCGHVPAHEVDVVDTTGAGDAFIGTVAASLAQRGTLAEACKAGTRAAATAVTWRGARPT